ncbi:ROK family protein [Maribacter sp. ACAM166]|uniref:ROK family protein n=1 Tax=Maribacter sp. ACAM166 TaxID=2508996 RepID=UPI0010FF0682|nr:ROK family protein [Maribacter sp. ACAM166]TLP79813.1 ROK family protein [Maribacter sp. ACAM166]
MGNDKKIEVVLAIDIGGSLTKIGLVSCDGQILDKKVFQTEAKRPFSDFLEKLRFEVKDIIQKNDTTLNILSIGVGAPNANPYTGQIESPPNLKWGKTTPIVKIFKDNFKLPVALANDANAAALGEMLFGAAIGMKNFVTLTLGTGLGSGIIVDGKLLIGEHGAAGEIGHVNVDPYGRMCNCGLQGCLETYASVTGIKRTVFELMAEMREDSPLRSLSFTEMTGVDISNAAVKNDKIALKAFELTGKILGSKMADTVAHLDIEAFILSGGLSKAGDILIHPVKQHMEQYLFGAYKGKVKVLLATATSSDAVLGPAALAWLTFKP